MDAGLHPRAYLEVAVVSADIALTSSSMLGEGGGSETYQVEREWRLGAVMGGGAIDLAWRWKPDSAAGATSMCLAEQASCDVAVHESGWMVATAEVAGVACADSAYVEVVCDFFYAPQDSMLSDPEIQYIFAKQWALSGPGDTLNAVERGGYVIERNGVYEFYPFPTSAGASACGFPPHDIDAFETHVGADGTLVAVFHTHPLAHVGGIVRNNGLCAEIPQPGLRFKSGASEDDMTHAARLGLAGHDARFFAIEDGVVYEFDATFVDGATQKALGGTETPMARDTTCELY